MVVQCPTCQSKFRIADDKVTDRGVRVRCTSCKNVFQVRKPGSAGGEAPGPGQTTDLSSLAAKLLGKAKGVAGTRPPTDPLKQAKPRPPTDPLRPGASRPPSGPIGTDRTRPPSNPIRTDRTRPPSGPIRADPGRPATGPVRTKPPTGPVRGAPADRDTAEEAESAARKLDADALFGMNELVGEELDIVAPPAPARSARAAAKPQEPDSDALELDIGELSAPAQTIEPASTQRGAGEEPLELADVRSPAKVKTGPVLGAEQAGLRPPTPRPQTKRIPTGPISTPRRPPPEPETGPVRALLSSALTGVLAAGVVVLILAIAALSGGPGSGFLGKGSSSDLVATKIVSGLYDTASGKPVFFVRGRVENRGKQVRGPVRVTAELVADGSTEAHADSLAGVEPTAEDVYSVRSANDAEKLTRALESAKVRRKVQPGESIPFFAIIADPPADLAAHRLQLKLESLDPAQTAAHAAKVR